MDYIYELSLFGAKTLIIVVGVIIVILVPLVFSQKSDSKDGSKKKLKLENMKDHFKGYNLQLQEKITLKKEFKDYLKKLKKEEKGEQKKHNSFVLNFSGDVMASQVENLRDEISLILQNASKEDEVILLLESRGGSVAHYGLSANQLQRLRNHGIPLTICIDKVAASGGYLMACVGNKIISAPFAYVGSIGVIFTTPNVNQFLKKHDIHYQEVTAGKYKRTITPLGEITEEKKKRLQEQLDLVHVQFKNFLKQYRSHLNFDEVATGEAWLGMEAHKMGLVDELNCSDDYLMQALKTRNVYRVSLREKKSLLKKVFKKFNVQKEALSHNWIL